MDTLDWLAGFVQHVGAAQAAYYLAGAGVVQQAPEQKPLDTSSGLASRNTNTESSVTFEQISATA
jgi:hypothetical protein